VPITSSHDSAIPAGTSVSGKDQQPCWTVDCHANLVGEPDAANPHVRFDEREVETEHGTACLAPATERAGNRKVLPKPPRHLSTLLSFWDPGRCPGLCCSSLSG
jgi:hypothetical protein